MNPSRTDMWSGLSNRKRKFFNIVNIDAKLVENVGNLYVTQQKTEINEKNHSIYCIYVWSCNIFASSSLTKLISNSPKFSHHLSRTLYSFTRRFSYASLQSYKARAYHFSLNFLQDYLSNRPPRLNESLS